MSENKKEQVIRFCAEIDPSSREWIESLKRKYNCTTNREIMFLAFKFLDETPWENLPFEVRGIVESKTSDVPQDLHKMRWMNIERLQQEINRFVIKTNKDKEILTKMIAEQRKLVKDHAQDEAAILLEEIKEMKKELQERR